MCVSGELTVCDNYYEPLYVMSCSSHYGVDTSIRLLKIIGLFLQNINSFIGSFAKETYNFEEPTNRSHPIRDKL